MKYSIKKYTRRRCYNKNKKKSSKIRNIKKRYSRRRITLHKKSKMRKQRKTKKMYQYGGVWKDEYGNWHSDDDRPAAGAAQDMTGVEAEEETMGEAAEVPDDQVPSYTGSDQDGNFYIDSPTLFGDPAEQEDANLVKEEIKNMFTETPDFLPTVTLLVPEALAAANVAADVAAAAPIVVDTVFQNVVNKVSCEECPASGAASGACAVLDRPSQTQLYGKLLELLFAILQLQLKGDDLANFLGLPPCNKYDIPWQLTSRSVLPEFIHCDISVKSVSGKEEKLVGRNLHSQGRIECGDAVKFVECLIEHYLLQLINARRYTLEQVNSMLQQKLILQDSVTVSQAPNGFKMVVKDYYLENNPQTRRVSRLVPVLQSVYDVSSVENMQIIFGTLYDNPEGVLDLLLRLKRIKQQRAEAQLDTDDMDTRTRKLNALRAAVNQLNIEMAVDGCTLCLAYKESSDCKKHYVAPPKSRPPHPQLIKGQLRVQITTVLGSFRMQKSVFEALRKAKYKGGYKGSQTIQGIRRMEDYSGPDTLQSTEIATPTATRDEEYKQTHVWAEQLTDSTASSKRIKKPIKGAIVRPKGENQKSGKLSKKLLKELKELEELEELKKL